MLSDFDYNEKIKKIQNKDNEQEKLKLLYMWIKQEHITFNDFEALLFYCT